MDFIICINTQPFLYFAFHLVGIKKFIYKLHFDIITWCGKCYHTIGILVELCNRHISTLADPFCQMFPNAIQVRSGLKSISIAHLLFCESFGSTLVFTNLRYLHFHTKLSQHIFQIDVLRCQTVPIQHTLWVQIYLISHRSQIISTLCVGIAISNYPFTAFLKVYQSISYFLQRRIRTWRKSTRFEIDTFYFIVVFGFLQT